MTFAKPPWLLKLAFWLYYRWEDAVAAANPLSLEDTSTPMEGGREKHLLVSGKVEQVPNIKQFHSDEIEFVDNTRRRFDLVIYSTGFRPALDHLHDLVTHTPIDGMPATDHMQSSDAPGLYFMGLDKQRTFRSRYLRGIREDAVVLAEQICARTDDLRGRP